MQKGVATEVRLLYVKPLAENDNSKNQIYLGSDFSALNMLPSSSPVAENCGGKPIFKAALNFSWLDNSGNSVKAPQAQLISYPQYPEVRLSGMLRGCRTPPSELVRARIANRLLFLGISDSGEIFGHIVHPDDPVAREFFQLKDLDRRGVFFALPLQSPHNPRATLLNELARIARSGWINSKRLSTSGAKVPCKGTNCGGYTLEAELGITPNGRSEPDYLGWEVKQYSRKGSARITLMTPEPSAGIYKDSGVLQFVKQFGYDDCRGRSDRKNFGGIHRVSQICRRTKLRLEINGYDGEKITDTAGGIALLSGTGEYAAGWRFTDLINHWQLKHAFAVYVPSVMQGAPDAQYRYGPEVKLGSGTDFLHFLKAMSKGQVYYDPAIKVENYSSKPTIKTRNQFRIVPAHLGDLYNSFETVNLLTENGSV
jgi:hypothetical protein